MTISTLPNSVTVGGNGTNTQFAFPFVGYSPQNIQVVYTNASGAQTTLPATSYTVALNPVQTGGLWSVGGVVTYPLTGSPIAGGTYLTISRILPLTQETSINNQGNFDPDVVEEGLDTLEMQIQQTSARTGLIRGTWVSGVQYNYSDIVTDGINGSDTGNLYSCAIPNTSGVWATDLGNGLWTLALNVQAIVNSTPSIGNNQVFGNISGGSATPTGVGVSALLDSAIGNTQGSVMYRGSATWSALPPGTSGYILSTGGAGANPDWIATSGTGTITGVSAGVGLTGGGSSGNVSLALNPIASGTLLANTSGATASPGPTTLTAYLDDIFGSSQGTVLYRAGTVWTALAPGSSGEFLQTAGASANPSWASAVSSSVLDSVFGSTQGNILYRSSSVWTVLPPGTVGQVLQTGGAGANPSWAGSTGGLILLDTVNASNAGVVSFGSAYITSAYNCYKVIADSVLPVNSADIFELQVSANNGSTLITSGYYYALTGNSSGIATPFGMSNTVSTYIPVFSPVGSSNSTNNIGSFELTWSKPTAANISDFRWQSAFWDTTPNLNNVSGCGARGTAGSLNYLQFKFSSGNIATGNFHIYGVAGT